MGYEILCTALVERMPGVCYIINKMTSKRSEAETTRLVCTSFPSDKAKLVKALCAMRGLTVSQIIQEHLEAWLDTHSEEVRQIKQSAVRSIGVKFPQSKLSIKEDTHDSK